MTNALLKSRLENLKDSGFFKNLIIKRGIEKEFFRVDKEGSISKKPHPEALGSALTNKFITTDFAEAQVELVTPCLLYTSPSPRDMRRSRMPSSA